MKSKRILSITFPCAIVILIIAAVLCFIHWPTRINVQMTGMEVTADGTSVHPCTVRVEGWKLNYLFREDTVKLDVKFSGSAMLETKGLNHVPLWNKAFEQFDYACWGVYLSENNQMDVVTLCLSKNSDWLLIKVGERYFVAADDANADLQAYWEMYADYIR